MELLEQLELVEVTYEDKEVRLIFLDAEKGEIREVRWNKNKYDKTTGKFVESAEQAEKVEGYAKEYFNLTFDTLAHAIGDKKDIYAYDRFNSLWESAYIIAKFDKDMVGTVAEVTVSEVIDDGTAILIKFPYEGNTYASRMRYADWLAPKNQYFVNPNKKIKQFEKFQDKFDIHIDNKEELVGKNVIIEVKLAFGKDPYVEIKPFPKKKK